jgi:hypothetical protein
MEIPVKINYTHVPLNKINEENLPKEIIITVKEQGFYLFLYKMNKIEPITIDLSPLTKVANNKTMYVSGEKIQTAIKFKLLHSTQILKTYPNRIVIAQVEKAEKTLSVKINGEITFAQQYNISDKVQITPEQIKVYGEKSVLDTMTYVYTETTNFRNLKDTVKQTVKLEKVPYVHYYPENVKISIPVEKYTEKTIEVPIVGDNVPNNMIIRTFPASVKVSFFVTFSKFNTIKKTHFNASIDYNSILNNKSGKQKLHIETDNPSLFNIRTNPSEVEYLIEHK